MEKDTALKGIIERMQQPDWTITAEEYAILRAELDIRVTRAPAGGSGDGPGKGQHEVELTKEEIKQLKADG